jgi:uncharacterized protein (DUF4415 family)/uncharacterized DUF497 family protein
VEISFDPAKDQVNQKKHGVSLGDAAKFDWSAVELRQDSVDESGETREIDSDLSVNGFTASCSFSGANSFASSACDARPKVSLWTMKRNSLRNRRKIILPTAAENRAIRRRIAADPDTRELTRTEIQELRPLTDAERLRGPVKVVMESDAQWEARTRRGRPPSDKPKMHVNVRLDAEIVEFFRAPGEGWQTRLNAFLAAHVKRASKGAGGKRAKPKT